MDFWEIGSTISIIGINAGVTLQLFHIWKTKCSNGISLIAWFAFAILLLYMAIFVAVKQQHILIFVNYSISTILHGLTATVALYYRNFPRP